MTISWILLGSGTRQPCQGWDASWYMEDGSFGCTDNFKFTDEGTHGIQTLKQQLKQGLQASSLGVWLNLGILVLPGSIFLSCI